MALGHIPDIGNPQTPEKSGVQGICLIYRFLSSAAFGQERNRQLPFTSEEVGPETEKETF
jgi:hypothetical protein